MPALAFRRKMRILIANDLGVDASDVIISRIANAASIAVAFIIQTAAENAAEIQQRAAALDGVDEIHSSDRDPCTP
jgi:hypothetical protein